MAKILFHPGRRHPAGRPGSTSAGASGGEENAAEIRAAVRALRMYVPGGHV